MSLECVLLDRYVTFLNADADDDDDPAPASGDATISQGGGAAIAGGGGVRAAAAANPDDLRDGIAAYLRAMKPRAGGESPADNLPLHGAAAVVGSARPAVRAADRLGVVAAAGDNFVVLYAGPYRPASSSMGCYLVYNAAAAATPLSTVPGVPYSASHSSPGRATVIAPATAGGFVLAELLIRFRPAPAVGNVCVWSPSSPSCHGGGGRWVHNAGRLPAQLLPPAHTFRAHTAFSSRSRSTGNLLLCWVDLHCGLLVCDNLEPRLQNSDNSDDDDDDLVFRFIPSSASFHCRMAATSKPAVITISSGHKRAQEFRSMSCCVDGAIKFVSMDGWSRVPSADITITTWALDLHDESTTPNWTKHTTLRLGDLWADDTFLSMDLPKNKPIFPVLSTRQHDDVVYLVLAVAERHVDGNKRGRTTKRVKHLISVDTRHKKVLFCSSYHSPGRLWPNLIASDFSAYLPGSKDDQRGLEAVEVSAKRMKI